MVTGDEEFSLSIIVELGSFKLTVLSFHDYFTGIFEPKILSSLVDFDLSFMHHFHWRTAYVTISAKIGGMHPLVDQ